MNTLVDRAHTALFRDGFIVVAMESGAEIRFPVAENPRLAHALRSSSTTSSFRLSGSTGRSSTKTFRSAALRRAITGSARADFFVGGAEVRLAQVIARFRDWLVDAVGCNCT